MHSSMSIMTYSNSNMLICLSLYITVGIKADIILRVDPLALLSATLRTYQKTACDTDQVVIACPRGTSISIEFAQYTNFKNKGDFTVDELCSLHKPTNHFQPKVKHFISGSTPGFASPNTTQKPNNSTVSYKKIPNKSLKPETVERKEINNNTIQLGNSSSSSIYEDTSPKNCMWPNAVQYSLLQTVVEACQKKKYCKFHGASDVYGLTDEADNYNPTASPVNVDPCHKGRKIVEVAYKCRPYEFRSKVACHNDVAQLECNPYSRIAVYSANFGRTEYESIQCPQPQGVREETCQASYTTETVMHICHGRRRCNLAADANTFGTPCQPNSRMYLKVVYTCVPKQVLKDRYELETEADETFEFEGDSELYHDEINYQAIPKVYNNSTVIGKIINAENMSSAGSLNSNSANISYHLKFPNSVNVVKTPSIDLSIEDDQEQLYFYLLIVGLGGIVMCIIAVSVHVLLQRNQIVSSESQMSHINSSSNVCMNTRISNGHNDTISEVDTEINTANNTSFTPTVKNENYIMYGLNSDLYSHCDPSNIMEDPSGLALHASTCITSSKAAVGSDVSTIITNSELCTKGQSPDVIGISTKRYIPVLSPDGISGQVAFGGILSPSIVIADKGAFGSTSISCGKLTPLSQHTSAPAVRESYILNSEGFLNRNLQTPLMLSSTESHQKSLLPTGKGIKTSVLPSILQQQQLCYDGTEPRTLSTGVPVNSRFYYG